MKNNQLFIYDLLIGLEFYAALKNISRQDSDQNYFFFRKRESEIKRSIFRLFFFLNTYIADNGGLLRLGVDVPVSTILRYIGGTIEPKTVLPERHIHRRIP